MIVACTAGLYENIVVDGKDVYSKIHNYRGQKNSYPLMLKNHCNKRYSHRFASGGYGQNILFSLFSQVPARYLSSALWRATEKVSHNFCCGPLMGCRWPPTNHCSTRMCCPGSLLHSLTEILFFKGWCTHAYCFPFVVYGGQHGLVLIKCSLTALYTGPASNKWEI
jgi:hypothetical protein